MANNFKEAQILASQQAFHLSALNTISSLFPLVEKDSPTHQLIVQAINQLLKPFLPPSPIAHDINS